MEALKEDDVLQDSADSMQSSIVRDLAPGVQACVFGKMVVWFGYLQLIGPQSLGSIIVVSLCVLLLIWV